MVALAALTLAACSSSSDSDVVARATASIRNTSGAQVGTATFVENDAGAVTVTVTVSGLTPGNHGMHVHSTGLCETDATFLTSGGHYNPFEKKHGLDNAEGPHGGDMPNLPVDANGNGALSYVNPRIRLTQGANTVFDEDGSAIIIHAGQDDQETDPQGNSGARHACGVLVRS